MCVLNHKVKIIIHLIIDHENWIEDASVKSQVKEAKEKIQRALKPNQHPGGDRNENIGKKLSL